MYNLFCVFFTGKDFFNSCKIKYFFVTELERYFCHPHSKISTNLVWFMFKLFRLLSNLINLNFIPFFFNLLCCAEQPIRTYLSNIHQPFLDFESIRSYTNVWHSVYIMGWSNKYSELWIWY